MTINKEEQEFLDVLRNIVDNGIEDNNDRTGVGIKFLPGITLKYDLKNNKLPLWTTRKVKWSNQFVELIWFLRGQTDVKFLQDKGINIWNSWVKKDGTIGPGYGKQWRTWEKYISDGHGTVYRDQPIDQFKNLIDGIKSNPSSRRHIVSLWNVADINDCMLPPCFLSDTLIATNHGYKKIQDIVVNDEVIDHTGTVKCVLQTWKTSYKGKIIKLLTHYKNEFINCTPNHPFLVKNKGYITADKIKIGDYFAIPRNKEIKIPNFHYKFLQFGKEITRLWQPSLNDFYTFGYFLGDGWHNGRGRISFAINNRDKEEVLSILRNSIKISKKPNKLKLNCYTYETKSLKWQCALNDFGRGAINKKIPQWILDAPTEYIVAFLNGYEKADGCKRNEETRYTTISPSVAYGLQLLYAKLGKPCGVYFRLRKKTKKIENRIVNQNNLYEISVASQIKSDYCLIDNDFLWIKVKEIFSKEEKADVFNFEVDVTNTYTANNIVNHNCHGDIIQFIIAPNTKDLHCLQYQRSADFAVGYCPWQYAMLTHIVAALTDTIPASFTATIGNCHVYLNQLDAIKEQLNRTPSESPMFKILKPLTSIQDVENLQLEDAEVLNYNFQKFIRFPIAV